MKIAIIGYGSLIWDLENLEPHVDGAWRLGSGPRLPVEFARISPKRRLALTLAIDETVPDLTRTCWLLSRRTVVADAVGDVARRERTSEDNIGYLARSDAQRTRNRGTGEVVGAWLVRHDIDAAVWCDLPGNFAERTGESFSHARALAYLKTLSAESLGEATRYIRNAPAETDTPFRRFLAGDDWWTSLGALSTR